MLRIVAIERPTTPPPGDRVRLDHDQRTRRRMLYTTESGATILLDMPRPVRLRDGDALRLEDGGWVRVEAIPEALIEIRAGSTAALVRIAWHLGNRHLPTQLLAGATVGGGGGTLRIRHDHVIVAMVEGLGGTCQPVLAPFDPEGGAYAGAAGDHGHGHHHHHHHDGGHG